MAGLTQEQIEEGLYNSQRLNVYIQIVGFLLVSGVFTYMAYNTKEEEQYVYITSAIFCFVGFMFAFATRNNERFIIGAPHIIRKPSKPSKG